MTYEDLVQGIIDHQYEWDRYLIMADFLKENGKISLAVAYQWMGERKKTPEHKPVTKGLITTSKWKWLIGQSSISPYLPFGLIGSKSNATRYFDSFHKSVQYLAWKIDKLRQLVTVTGDIQ